MSRHPIRFSILVATLLAGSAAFAGGADIVRCVDPQGNVTLTDAQCAAEAASMPLVAEAAASEAEAEPAEPVVPSASISTSEHLRVAQPPHHDSFVPRQFAARRLNVDVATLKAARDHLQLSDSAAATMRQQRIAGLN